MTINQLSFEEVMEILKSGDLERIKNIYVLVPYKKQTSPKEDAKTLIQCNIVTRYTVSQLLELNVNDVVFIETI